MLIITFEDVKDNTLKRAYKGILKESTKDKWASFADDYHALRVMEDKVIYCFIVRESISITA